MKRFANDHYYSILDNVVNCRSLMFVFVDCKAAEAEMAYRHCVQDANDQQKQLEDIRVSIMEIVLWFFCCLNLVITIC